MNGMRQTGNGQRNRGPDQQGRNPFGNFNLSRGMIVFLIMLGIILLPWLLSLMAGGKRFQVPYTTFRRQLEADNVQRIVVQGEKISGTFRDPSQVGPVQQGDTVPQTFITYLPSFGDGELLSLLESKNVEVVTQPASDRNW
ncbi:MAG: ATP-dependent metallopeptidase FtsH/Yme1/Tma family protein, partial [Spirochaetales bacterium]|nr:ATP-dependent metallopeptidase FtsH/Yme1/Tma family protein [Spirochaetales bacterium]